MKSNRKIITCDTIIDIILIIISVLFYIFLSKKIMLSETSIDAYLVNVFIGMFIFYIDIIVILTIKEFINSIHEFLNSSYIDLNIDEYLEDE